MNNDAIKSAKTIQELQAALAAHISIEDMNVITIIIDQFALIESLVDLLLHRLLITSQGKDQEEFDERRDRVNTAIEKMNISTKVSLLETHLAKKDLLWESIWKLQRIRNDVAHHRYLCKFEPILKESIQYDSKSVWTLDGLRSFCLASQQSAKGLMELCSNHHESELFDIETKLFAFKKKISDIESKRDPSLSDIEAVNVLRTRINNMKKYYAIEKPRLEQSRLQLKTMTE